MSEHKEGLGTGGLPLFDAMPSTAYHGHPPYVKGSDTSKGAADSVAPNAGTKRAEVYRVIASLGGATDDKVEEVTGWRHQTVSARRRELVLSGMVRDSGRREKTRSGRDATVWEVAETGGSDE